MASLEHEERERTRPAGEGARERIVATAYDLFCRGGIRAVGIDRIIAEAGVAKMTLYRHFKSKEDLALAVIDRRQELWTRGWLQGEMVASSDDPVEQLLAVFDALDGWFHRDDYESCLFIGILRETTDQGSRLLAAAREALAEVRTVIAAPARDAGIPDPDSFAFNWQILMSGSIVCADMGDLGAAKRARVPAVMLLESYGLKGIPRAG